MAGGTASDFCSRHPRWFGNGPEQFSKLTLFDGSLYISEMLYDSVVHLLSRRVDFPLTCRPSRLNRQLFRLYNSR